MPKLKNKKKSAKINKTKIIKKAKIKIAKNRDEKKINSAPLRIPNKNTYSPEEKIEIKKIKKQATEKRLYEVKDFVVYAKHGVGRITAVEKATVGQIDIQFYKIYIEKEKLTLTVPINQQSNLRSINVFQF